MPPEALSSDSAALLWQRFGDVSAAMQTEKHLVIANDQNGFSTNFCCDRDVTGMQV